MPSIPKAAKKKFTKGSAMAKTSMDLLPVLDINTKYCKTSPEVYVEMGLHLPLPK